MKRQKERQLVYGLLHGVFSWCIADIKCLGPSLKMLFEDDILDYTGLFYTEEDLREIHKHIDGLNKVLDRLERHEH